MNPKATGLLFLAAAALGAFVWFYEIRGEEERLADEAAAERLFVGIEAADIQSISLTSNDGVPVRFARGDDGWQLMAPLSFPADDFAIDAMASSLASFEGGDAIEDPQPDAVYGLDPEVRTVQFAAGDSEHELRIGSGAPVGSKTYVAGAGGGGVRTVPSHRVNVFDKPFADLRDKSLLDFDAAAVDHLEVSWPDGGVVLDKGDEGWQITSPIARRADDDVVSGLLQDLSMLRAIGFIDDPREDADTGLDAPSLTVRLAGKGTGDAPEPFEAVLAVGSVPDGNSRLARGAHSSLYRIVEDRLADLPTQVAAYRFKQLAEFDALSAGRVEVVFHTSEGVTVPLAGTRGESGWSSDPEGFAPGKLATIVGSLANLRAEDVLADAVGPAELAGLGLSPANAVFRVYAAPDGDSPEESAEPDPPLLAEVHLGVVRGADGVVAKRLGDDAVYLLGIDQSQYIPVSYEAFLNHFRAEEQEELDTPPPADAPDDVPADAPAAVE